MLSVLDDFHVKYTYHSWLHMDDLMMADGGAEVSTVSPL